MLQTQVQKIEDLSAEMEVTKEKEEEKEEEEEVAKERIEAFKKILQKDYFELPQVEYPEDK